MSETLLKKASSTELRLPLWLTYMWQRRAESGRLGLVLGAGVSKDAGCPMWPQLVTRLTKSLKVPVHRMKKHRDGGQSEAFIAEVVFQNYFNKQTTKYTNVPPSFKKYLIDASWRGEIHKCLYQDIAGKPISEIRKKHPYLGTLAELIAKAGFAVTFNFDDVVDEEVTLYCASHGLPNPEIIRRPKIETRKNAPVIYHINGILPREELRRASEDIVLTENAFADILLSPNSQDADFVINQFSTKTFLLLGVSLTDNSLKNLLRSSAKRNPANHHFIVYHERDGHPRSPETRRDIFEVNLNVYNLVSIFLTSKEIKAFLRVLALDNGDDFEKSMSGLVSNKIDRKYYLVGSVASGKSATLEALRCFQTHEEWEGRAPAAMYLNDKNLTVKQQGEVDDFLFPQLVSKNNKMVRHLPGLRIMDRAYLDLFAFSKGTKEISRKAAELRRRFEELGKHFEDGHIFFLRASEEALKERLVRRGRVNRTGKGATFDEKTLLKQERELHKTYHPDNASIFDTTYLSVGEVAKRIARTVLLDDYKEFAFADRLNEVLAQKGKL